MSETGPRRVASRRPPARSVVPAWNRRGAMIAAGVIGALLLVAVVDVAVTWGRVLPGVRVGTVSVGWMTPTAAQMALDAESAAVDSRTVTLRWGSKSFKVAAHDIGAHIDASASASAAIGVGRNGGLFSVVAQRIASVFGGVEIAPTAQVDASATTATFDKIDAEAAEPARDASVTVSGLTVTTAPAKAGRALDRPATRSVLLATLYAHADQTDAVVAVVAPAIGDEAAEAARLAALKLLSGPVTVSFEGRSIAATRAQVARWVTFSKEGTSAAGGTVTLAASFDATRVGPAVASLTVGKTRAAKDAAFVASGGTVHLTPSQVGTGPDLKRLAADLARACLASAPRSAVLVLTESQPRLTTELARTMGISNRISTFTTTYSTANPARTNNVHLLAKALNGKMVAPGATFSFNGAAGQRTAAKGYQEAPAIVKGKIVPQLGGGVCQVGTTIFNAVFFSGLPIVERHNHSYYISHYPTGRDATVSWGYPDFKFKNDTANWILIRTATTSNSLTIALYGTDPGYDVRYTTGEFTDIVPHKTQEVPDPKLNKGARVVEDKGTDGRSIVVTRTVYKGGKVVRTDTFVSHYVPKTEIVRVGTKSTSPTSTVSP